MPMTKDLKKYQRAIEEAVGSLGRDDAGVGAVEEVRPDILAVTFSRGVHAATAEIPVDELRNRQRANQVMKVMTKAIMGQDARCYNLQLGTYGSSGTRGGVEACRHEATNARWRG